MEAPLRIAIDAMGGDRAPAVAIQGALQALARFEDVHLTLVGCPDAIARELDAAEADASARERIRVVTAPEAARSDVDPVKQVRGQPALSARVAAEIMQAGEVQALVTMGNTGVAVAAATFHCKRLPGVKRLGMAAPIPRPGGLTILLDAGANPEARSEHLHQYAIMGREYVKHALGIDAPRVGILSIGEEEHKGNRLVAETWERFRQHPVEGFLGNVESRELFQDRADVVVADGFAGNVALKAAEGMGEFILGMLQKELADQDPALTRRVIGALLQRVDHGKYGGATVLGIQGACIIGHGRSGPESFVSGVSVMRNYIRGEVGERIVASLDLVVPQGGV